jgi:hypothetical protein
MLNLLSSLCKVVEQTLASVRTNVLGSPVSQEDYLKLNELTDELKSLLDLAKHLNQTYVSLENNNQDETISNIQDFIQTGQKNSEIIESDIVNLNIGGKIFATFRFNLTKKLSFFFADYDKEVKECYSTSIFENILKDNSKIYYDRNNCIFFDRDPTNFEYILNYMRTFGTSEPFYLPDNGKEIKKLFIESQYYKLLGFKYHVYRAFLPSTICSDPILVSILFETIKISFDKWCLIYRGSQDGFTAKSFHKKCDNKSSVLVLIKTTQNSIFGGYSSIGWKNFGGYRKDSNSFLFKLQDKDELKPSKIKCINPNYAINSCFSYGPSFGTGDLTIYGFFCKLKYFNKVIGTSKLGNSYSKDDEKQSKTYLSGSSTFEIDEIEVFSLITDI